MDLWFQRVERATRSVSREKREPQTGPASCLSNSASKGIGASGEDVKKDEPNTKATGMGEGAEGLPGSKSVARAEETQRTKEAREVPAVLTTRTKQEGGRNDKKRRLSSRESDWLIVLQGKAQAPT